MDVDSDSVSAVSTGASHRREMSTGASRDTFVTPHAGSAPPAVPRTLRTACKHIRTTTRTTATREQNLLDACMSAIRA